ncbi:MULTISPECIES: helix-turn-helix domain-containing protein [unclassified Streptococcus]|uniref:winged helix-turn-helix transcriptional regulator n=1 Tax=unclassified Streptococcus TaxID=2608887 RepID=UPI0018AC38E5|nr:MULTISPECIES: helix-turn-helix domain-containing protein [unclassified Streptococcus]MBF8969985.1 helix-turn-helix transcriptional regulator [Streptococcus sp. NLN76]MBG9367320.1 helix-turn-helix transcriptional regulator [Streptococcus sp. NLN64]MBJ6745868.1 helix-turn-helix transcriptional regulator [Streptococcus sp. 121]
MDLKTAQEKISQLNVSFTGECPILYSMKIIGSKWKVPILWQLMLEDGLHYNQLKRKVGNITNTMLTKSLRELEEAGLLTRKDYGTIPPSVSYHLTELGLNLVFTLEALFVWGQEHMKKQP